MELSDYAVNKDGRLVKTFKTLEDKLVWGVGEYGLLHGVGSYLSLGIKPSKGDFHILVKPTEDDINKYYEDLNREWL